ncbi:MAG: hypothetical protein IJK25_10410 [Firmicutes bacterium]|nr:hypothetical protein [Bacillota bacterium]
MRKTCHPKWQRLCERLINMELREKLITDLTIQKLLIPMRKMEWFGDEMETYMDRLLVILKTTKTEPEILQKAAEALDNLERE